MSDKGCSPLLGIDSYGKKARETWDSSLPQNEQKIEAIFGLVCSVARLLEITREKEEKRTTQLVRRELGDILYHINILSELYDTGGLHEVAVMNLIRISSSVPIKS